MRKQLKSLTDMVGEITKGSATVDHGQSLAISFESGAYIIIETSRDHDDEIFLYVDTTEPEPDLGFVNAGVYTREEYDEQWAKLQIEWTRDKERHERRELVRLKAKYEDKE